MQKTNPKGARLAAARQIPTKEAYNGQSETGDRAHRDRSGGH